MLFIAAWDWPSRSSYLFLMAGIFLFSVAVVSTCTGKASTRFSWVYRAKEPVVFWLLVAMYYLGGLFFIGIFLLNKYF